MRKIQLSDGLLRLWARISEWLGDQQSTRETLINVSAGLMVLAGAIAFPFALLQVAGGAGSMSIFTAIAGASAGAFALALSRNAMAELAVMVQTAGIITTGLLMASGSDGSGLVLVSLFGLSAVHAGLLARNSSVSAHLVLGMLAAMLFGICAMSADMEILPLALTGFALFNLLAAALLSRHRPAVSDREEHQMLSHLMENISDGLLHLEANGHLIHASPGTENMFGCKAYSLNGPGLIERVHVLDRPAFLKFLSDTAHDGQTRRLELRVRRDQNADTGRETQFVWAEISMTCNAASEVAGPVFALIRDISSRKEQQGKLEDARREAEEASESKSRFLATMGHELRTPLNAIVGFAEMMSAGIGGQLEDTHAEYADMIGQSGRHLLDVVNMLLDMSKINAGRFELHLEEFEPDMLADPSLYMVSALARSKHVHVETDIADNLPIIKGDERACRQVIINLLSNAIKFSKPDGVVRLSMRRQGAKLNITVNDDGIGMSREQVERIGEPFFQAHAGLARQYEGTGLGLSIVKGLVDLHDGVLRAKSTLDEGTAITVLLPLLGPEPAMGHQTVTPLNAPEAGASLSTKDQPEKQSIAS